MSRGGRGGLRERGGGGEGLRVPRGGLSILGDIELVVEVFWWGRGRIEKSYIDI